MTDPILHAHVPDLSNKPISGMRARNAWKRFIMTLILSAIVVGAFIVYLRTQNQQLSHTAAVSYVTPSPVIAEKAVPPSSQENTMAAPAVNQQEALAMPSNEDKVSELEKHVATLTATIAVLQNELQTRDAKLAQAQSSASMPLAVALAFFQLRDQALSGHSFVNEYQTLSKVSKNMPDTFQEQLHELQELSAQNVPNIDTLHEKLKSLEPQAIQAIRKAGAATWRDRIEAELSGLISVRHLHENSTPGPFIPIEQAFNEGNLSLVPAAVKSLPAAAQVPLQSWESDVETRIRLNAAIDTMMNYLIEQNASPDSQQDKKP